MEKDLKLKIELVPFSAWFDNLRSRVPKQVWDKIRKKTYADYGYKCGICDYEGRLNCHEIWEYDDKNHIQKLIGFIALCDMCHHIKHIGLAGILSKEGKLDYNKLIEHFMKVNDCNKETFEKHESEAWVTWEKRSDYEWKLDLGEYETVFK